MLRWLLAAALIQLSASLARRDKKASDSLKVAYAIFVTDLESAAWQDAMAVMAHSLKNARAKSRHVVTLMVLAPEGLPDDKSEMLLSFGFDQVLRRPIPVPLSDIQSDQARSEMGHTQGTGKGLTFALAEETIKYWGIAQTQFDRVLVLDADTLVLDPMDELMDLREDFVGTYDHGLDCCGSAIPPVQGGFLLFRPNATDFEMVKALTREGDWRGGAGWKGSHVGYWYGGIGPDGLLQYFYNKDALASRALSSHGHRDLPEGIQKPGLAGSRMKVVDRSVYDVLISDRLTEDLRDVTSEADRDATIAGVKSVHFTGNCLKPWSCWSPEGQHVPWLCQAMHNRWWNMWEDVAEERLRVSGRSATVAGSHCQPGGHYQPLPMA